MERKLLTTLKRPEYTGERRCNPCTVINVGIATVLAGTVLSLGVWTGATVLGAVIGFSAYLLLLLVIYFRGYLVPGTPTLTRRYFPPWLLRSLGKAPALTSPVSVDSNDETDLDGMLMVFGALDVASNGDEPSLSDNFRAEWSRTVGEIGAVDSDELIDQLDASGDVDTEEWGEVFRVYLNDRLIGKWRSREALATDLASAAILSDRSKRWKKLSVRERARLLDRLRTRIEICPGCGGIAKEGTETIEGCCTTLDVTTGSCTDCSTRLYIGSCPECGSNTEYVTETVESGITTIETAVKACTDCDEQVFVLPEPLSTL